MDLNRTPIKSIQVTEDRSLFAQKMAGIGEKVAPCEAVHSLEEVSQHCREKISAPMD
jgi:carbamoylphosphate synthase large subunit